jgi:hypothetical protein
MTSIGLAWAQARAGRPARATRTPVLLLFVAWVGRHLPTFARARTSVMQVAAFGFLDYAAFQHSVIAGCVAVGVSLLVLETLLSMDTKGTRR